MDLYNGTHEFMTNELDQTLDEMFEPLDDSVIYMDNGDTAIINYGYWASDYCGKAKYLYLVTANIYHGKQQITWFRSIKSNIGLTFKHNELDKLYPGLWDKIKYSISIDH